MNSTNSVLFHQGSLKFSFILEKQKQDLSVTFFRREVGAAAAELTVKDQARRGERAGGSEGEQNHDKTWRLRIPVQRPMCLCVHA